MESDGPEVWIGLVQQASSHSHAPRDVILLNCSPSRLNWCGIEEGWIVAFPALPSSLPRGMLCAPGMRNGQRSDQMGRCYILAKRGGWRSTCSTSGLFATSMESIDRTSLAASHGISPCRKASGELAVAEDSKQRVHKGPPTSLRRIPCFAKSRKACHTIWNHDEKMCM